MGFSDADLERVTVFDRVVLDLLEYRGTSPIRKHPPPGPYSRPMPRVLGGSQKEARFLMGEVPL